MSIVKPIIIIATVMKPGTNMSAIVRQNWRRVMPEGIKSIGILSVV